MEKIDPYQQGRDAYWGLESNPYPQPLCFLQNYLRDCASTRKNDY
jgi:hypothetical protein